MPGKAVLSAGTVLYRVHSLRYGGAEFNSVPAHCLYGEGRFDATRCERYPSLYAGLTPQAAPGETLLRSLPFDPLGGSRLLPRAAVRDRRLSVVRLMVPLEVVSLVGAADLAAVCQDSWLTQAEAREHAHTRDRAHWIRQRTDPWARGFVWPSKREPADRAVVLFGDRCPPGSVLDGRTRDGSGWTRCFSRTTND
ncbi:RES domain-containing protein [Streptomyces sp. SID4919]|nr:RES family NAD+ phosphorylase [Streptomyces sp. SID4919]MYY10699.1 RES domain-containing protein [Streptomyces sp. SID4919]SCK62326.1 RES domain-containing protein [Streptomyces sp. AmelKG-E11A]